MSEYIEREALIERMETRLKSLRADYGDYDHYTDGFEEGLVAVEDADTADVVEVVRCRECECLKFSDCYAECSKGYMGIVSPDDYCSRGKRRGVDNV